jgi:two-component system sensor histidine kinase YesM
MKGKLVLTLKQYLILCICSLVIITTAVMMFFPSSLYKALYQKQTETHCKNVVTQAGISIANTIHNFDTKIDQMVESTIIHRLVFETDNEETAQESYQRIVENYFNKKSVDAFYLRSIDLYNKSNGSCLRSSVTTPVLNDPFNSKYYKIALMFPNNLNWIKYNHDMDSIEASRVIYDKKSYEAQGMLLIRMSPQFLLDQFDAHNTMEVNHIYITDGEGNILASNNPETMGNTLEDESILISPSDASVGTFYTENEIFVYYQMRSAYYAFPYDRWCIIIGIDREWLLKDFNKIQHFFYGISLLIIVLGVLITVYFSNSLSKPIGELSKAMSEVGHENLQIILGENSHVKEITLVNQGFNKMSRKLDNLINSVYKSQLAQKEAQLKALQSQINPHFLFNTLQLISWKAHEYEAYPVCEMIHSLSYMLETGLYSDDKNTYTLHDELQYIEHYAKIIHKKYEGKIKIRTHIPDYLLDCRIPKILLQPFIENAIVHGLGPKTTPGHVTLEVYEDNTDLVAIICDNGVGMRADKLLYLQDSQENTNGNDHTSHHIALQNIRNRIKLLYGDPYGFTIESESFVGTTVTVRIPLQRG